MVTVGMGCPRLELADPSQFFAFLLNCILTANQATVDHGTVENGSTGRRSIRR